jgi:hypothetical protein
VEFSERKENLERLKEDCGGDGLARFLHFAI